MLQVRTLSTGSNNRTTLRYCKYEHRLLAATSEQHSGTAGANSSISSHNTHVLEGMNSGTSRPILRYCGQEHKYLLLRIQYCTVVDTTNIQTNVLWYTMYYYVFGHSGSRLVLQCRFRFWGYFLHQSRKVIFFSYTH